jgi:DNA recombination protein RmuC
LAHEDAQEVQTTSQKISRRFSQIERVELAGDAASLALPIDDIVDAETLSGDLED